MANLDFIGFISDNVNLTAEKKIALLDDFCSQCGYQEFGENPPISKKDFANQKISDYIEQKVNLFRKKTAEAAVNYEALEMETV